MRLPRVRFTMRRMMVAVAAFAIGFGAITWVARMRALSVAYERRAVEFWWLGHAISSIVTMPDGRRVDRYEDENRRRRDDWALPLVAKYRRLSYYPWMAVEPDPPPPELLAHPRSARDLPERDDSLGATYVNSRPPAWTLLWTWRW